MSSTRRLFAVAGILLLFVLSVWLGLRLWALHVVRTAVPDFEAQHGSLDPAQWRRTAPPPTENGGRYLRAATLLVDTPPSAALTETERQRIVPALRPEGEPLEAVLADHATALELFRRAAAAPACVVFEELPSPAEPTGNWITVLTLARLERALARKDFDAGDDAAGAARIATIQKVGACLGRETVLLPWMIGASVERLALAELHGPLAQGRLDTQLGPLAALLADGERTPVPELVRSEAAVFQPKAWWRGRVGDRRTVPAELANPWAVTGYLEAMGIRALGRVLDDLDAPVPPPEYVPDAVAPWRTEDFMVGAHRHFWLRARDAEALASVRALARAAIELRGRGLRAGSYLGLAPESGGLRLELRPDGGAELSAPAAEARWRAAVAHDDRPRPSTLPWRWSLPPVAP